MCENDVLLNEFYLHVVKPSSLTSHIQLRCKYAAVQVLIRYFANALATSLVTVENAD